MAAPHATLAATDPTNEIGAAWGVKERLQMLPSEREPSKIRWRLADFYDAAIKAQMAETTRLANTIKTWWPAILVALTEQVTNARTEGFNRIIKQTKRVSCGYRNRNLDNYQRRILNHIAVTHRREQQHENHTPLKFEEPPTPPQGSLSPSPSDGGFSTSGCGPFIPTTG